MNLSKKKELAAKALKVGKNRVIFNSEGISEIKEAITKQDIKDLAGEGIITIKPVKGRKKIVKRKTRRGPGKIKKTVNKRKQIYVKITRKLRSYIMNLRDRGVLERELYRELRNKIRMRDFRSIAYLKEYLKNREDVDFDKVGEVKDKKVKKEEREGGKVVKEKKVKEVKEKKDEKTK